MRAGTGLRISVSSTWAIIEALAVGREQRPSTSSSQISVQEGRALEPSDMIDEQIIRRARLARRASKVSRGVVVTWRRRSPPITPPDNPGRAPSHALNSRRAERRVFRTRWRGAGARGTRAHVRRRSAVSNGSCSQPSVIARARACPGDPRRASACGTRASRRDESSRRAKAPARGCRVG